MSELQEDLDLDESSSWRNKTRTAEIKMAPTAPLRLVKSDGSSDNIVDDYDMKQTNDEFDSTINSEISELTSDAYDGWMVADTKWRRSPEGSSWKFTGLPIKKKCFLGGEDVSVVSQTLDYSNSTYDDNSVTSSNVHMELLSSKQSTSNNESVRNSDSSEAETTQTSSSVKNKTDKMKKDKVLDVIFCICYIYVVYRLRKNINIVKNQVKTKKKKRAKVERRNIKEDRRKKKIRTEMS